MCALVLNWGLDAKRSGDGVQHLADSDRFSGQVEDGPGTEVAVNLVDGGEVCGPEVVYVDNTGAGLLVHRNPDGIRTAALGSAEQRSPPDPEDPRSPAVDGPRPEDGDVQDISCGQDGLLMRRTPTDCGSRLAGGERGSGDGQVADATVGRPMYPGPGGVDESEFRADRLVLRQRGRTIARSLHDAAQDGSGLPIRLRSIDDDVDVVRGNGVDEELGIRRVTLDWRDLVGLQRLDLATITGCREDRVIA